MLTSPVRFARADSIVETYRRTLRPPRIHNCNYTTLKDYADNNKNNIDDDVDDAADAAVDKDAGYDACTSCSPRR